MKGLWIVGIVMTLAAGCGVPNPPPERTLDVSNPGYKIDMLFKDPNGVTVYRFFDQGEYRYYVVGPDGAHMLPTTKTVHDTEIETIDVGGDVDGGGGHGHGGGGHGGGGGGGHGGGGGGGGGHHK
jgi:hypothetical protein